MTHNALTPVLDSVPHDLKTVRQETLNIDNKVRNNLLPWNGQFSPQFVHALLDTYAAADAAVLDPFVGSGTVLIESARFGLTAHGSDINPAAVKMAQTYCFVNVGRDRREAALHTASKALSKAIPFSLVNPTAPDDEKRLQRALVEVWTHADSADVRRLADTLIILNDFHKPGLTATRVFSVWDRLVRIVRELPYSRRRISASIADARQLPVKQHSIDLVITSPPYINVFNYHQQYRHSLEALDWDLLRVARSEIGSNRKHRGNRFLTVIQYCLDLNQVFSELRRVTRDDARVIFIVGRESNVRKTTFYNGEIVTRLATQSAGFLAEKRQCRVFQNRFGIDIYEDILHFRPSSTDHPSHPPRQIATEVLQAALSTAPRESFADLEDALSRLDEVQPSPVLAHDA